MSNKITITPIFELPLEARLRHLQPENILELPFSLLKEIFKYIEAPSDFLRARNTCTCVYKVADSSENKPLALRELEAQYLEISKNAILDFLTDRIWMDPLTDHPYPNEVFKQQFIKFSESDEGINSSLPSIRIDILLSILYNAHLQPKEIKGYEVKRLNNILLKEVNEKNIEKKEVILQLLILGILKKKTWVTPLELIRLWNKEKAITYRIATTLFPGALKTFAIHQFKCHLNTLKQALKKGLNHYGVLQLLKLWGISFKNMSASLSKKHKSSQGSELKQIRNAIVNYINGRVHVQTKISNLQKTVEI